MLEMKNGIILVTVKEATEIYGCAKQRIYDFVSSKRLIPILAESRMRLFNKADVERLRDENLPLRRRIEAGVIKAARQRGDIRKRAA